MCDSMEQDPQVGHITRAKGILDTQFDECNPIAGVARVEALDLVNSYLLISRDLFVVTDYADGYDMKKETKEVVELDAEPILIIIEKLNADGEALDAELVQTRFMLMKDVNTVTNEPSPKLLAVIDGDVAIPIVSFDKKAGKVCSQAQIGQQMRDENLPVYKSERKEDLLAVLAMLKNERRIDSMYERLVKIVKGECTYLASTLDAARQKSLVQSIFENIGMTDITDELTATVLGSELGQGLKRNLIYRSLAPPSEVTRLQDIPDIILATTKTPEYSVLDKLSKKRQRAVRELGGYSLFAVTRGDVAVELARIQQTGVSTTEGDLNYDRRTFLRNYFDYAKSFLESMESVDEERLLDDDYLRQLDARTIITAKKMWAQNDALLKDFGGYKAFDAYLGEDRWVQDKLIEIAIACLDLDMQVYEADIEPGTEFSNEVDGTSVRLTFSRRNADCIGIVCEVKPASADVDFVEAYNETIAVCVPNKDETAKANQRELARMFQYLELLK